MPEARDRRLSVLVVEDEPRLRDLLLRAIPDMGFDVGAADCAARALDSMERATPDIVLLDLHLPDLDGLALFEQVHAQRPEIQFVILTGFGTVEAARQAIRLDVVDFLAKPAPLGEIDVALDRARRRSLAQRVLPEAAPGFAGGTQEPPATLKDLERATILQALREHDGNRSATARALGISLRTLYYRLAAYEREGAQIEGRLRVPAVRPDLQELQ